MRSGIDDIHDRERKYQLEATEIDDHERKYLEAAKVKALRAIELPAKDLALILNDGIRQTPATAAVEGGQATIIVLSGGPGVGKTTAASKYLADLVRDDASWSGERTTYGKPRESWTFRRSALFVTSAQLSRWKIYDGKEMGRLLNTTRLAIDDAGAEFLEGRLSATIDEIINERYAHRRETVLTTNLVVGEFRDRYGERVADRILECGKFVGLGKGSMRGKLL